ncbi:hypothetical protein niasHT_005393 [Heterodera trifolii]|uniref:Nanos-type domain-containing protein n=1 Tax=Heterodera trifolii TaxID=157864 RepID=A0ABD2M0U4_9BILA
MASFGRRRNGSSITCGYCFQNGQTEAAVGHTKNNCPFLANLAPCQMCGASGSNNHTAMYCPNKQEVHLELNEKAMASIVAMHIDDTLTNGHGGGKEYHCHFNAQNNSRPLIQRASNIQMTPTKRNNSLGTSTISPMSSTSIPLPLSENSEDTFCAFMDPEILLNSPTAFSMSFRHIVRIASTPSTLPSASSAATGASTNARRCLSFGGY